LNRRVAIEAVVRWARGKRVAPCRQERDEMRWKMARQGGTGTRVFESTAQRAAQEVTGKKGRGEEVEGQMGGKAEGQVEGKVAWRRSRDREGPAFSFKDRN
jgi:hypothetical protein